MADTPLILHTECKHCEAVLQITVQQLRDGGGKARCSSCEQVFDAVAGLRDGNMSGIDSLGKRLGESSGTGDGLTIGTPGDPFGIVTRRTIELDGQAAAEPGIGDTLPPTEDDATRIMLERPMVGGLVEEPVLTDGQLPDSSTLNDTLEMDAAALDRLRLDDDDLPPTRQAAAGRRAAPDDAPTTGGGWYALACLALSLLFAVQFMYFEPTRVVASFPQARPLVTTVCDVLGCDVPPQSSPSQFKFSERSVREHPQYGNALEVRAQLDNLAGHAQPLPRIELVLFDQVGVELSRRAFAPREYVGETPPAQVGVGESVTVAVDVVSPDRDAANFELRVQP